MSRFLPADLRATVLSYVPLFQVQTWEEDEAALDHDTQFTPNVLRVMLNKYNIDPEVIQKHFTHPVQKLHTAIEAGSYNPNKFQLFPFERYVRLALLSGDIGYWCHYFMDPMLCLIAAIRHNNLNLVEYYLDRLDKSIEDRLSTSYFSDKTYYLMLKLASEYASEKIIYTIIAEAISRDFILSVETKNYIKANLRDYSKLALLDFSTQDIKFDVDKSVDVVVTQFRVSDLKAIDGSKPFPIFPFRSFNEGLKPYLSVDKLPDIKTTAEYVREHWPESKSKDTYLAYCELLLGQEVSKKYFSVEDDEKLYLNPYIYAIAVSTMSPVIKDWSKANVGGFSSSMVLPSEVLYQPEQARNRDLISDVVKTYLISGFIRGDPGKLMGYNRIDIIKKLYKQKRSKISSAEVAARLAPYIKNIDSYLYPDTILQYEIMKNLRFTPHKVNDLEKQKLIMEHRKRFVEILLT